MEINMKRKIDKPAVAEPVRPQPKAAQQDTAENEMTTSGEHAPLSKSDEPTLPPAPSDATPTDVPKPLVTDATPDTSAKNAEKFNVIDDSGAASSESTPEGQAADAVENSIPEKISAKTSSPRKQESNARNAQFSTGPRTAAGKKKSSMNALKSGTYARHLFATAAQWAEDGEDFRIRAAAIRDTYRPKNPMAELWVEKLAVDLTHLARILRHEQTVFSLNCPFENSRIERILRCKVAAEKAVYRDIEELQRLQEEGSLTRVQPAHSESGSGNDNGKAGVPSSESTVDSGDPNQGPVEAASDPTFTDGSENGPDIGAEVESEAVIYERPPDLADLPQTTVPIIKPREPSKNLERIRTILENWKPKQ
jgi:hypothetical protein